MNWDELYEQTKDEEVEYSEQPVEPDTDGEITDQMLAEFFNRLSGVSETSGQAKAEISYQAYDVGNTDDPGHDQIYTVNQAVVQISRNCMFEDLYLVDIIFRSADDTELKLFWGRLQQHIQRQSISADHNWIFYINLLERAGLEQPDASSVLTANIFNPIMCYLTREVPNQYINDEYINNEMQGGNIIRMLVPSSTLTFNMNTEIDITRIQAEVQRDIEAARYLNAAGGNE